MRSANIKIVAVTRNSHIDTGSSQVGHTKAKVLVTGAQGLIPERAEPYDVKLQWRFDGSDWKLIELHWERVQIGSDIARLAYACAHPASAHPAALQPLPTAHASSCSFSFRRNTDAAASSP